MSVQLKHEECLGHDRDHRKWRRCLTSVDLRYNYDKGPCTIWKSIDQGEHLVYHDTPIVKRTLMGDAQFFNSTDCSILLPQSLRPVVVVNNQWKKVVIHIQTAAYWQQWRWQQIPAFRWIKAYRQTSSSVNEVLTVQDVNSTTKMSLLEASILNGLRGRLGTSVSGMGRGEGWVHISSNDYYHHLWTLPWGAWVLSTKKRYSHHVELPKAYFK